MLWGTLPYHEYVGGNMVAAESGAICGMLRMLRAILSVTATRSCDSTPVPARKPRSSGRISVTGTPEGFCTPREVAQPASSAELATTPARRRRDVVFMM